MATRADSLAADVASIFVDQLQQQRRSTGDTEALRPTAEQHPPDVVRRRRLGRSCRLRTRGRRSLLHGQLSPDEHLACQQPRMQEQPHDSQQL